MSIVTARPIFTAIVVGVAAIGGLMAFGLLPKAIADEARVSSVLKLPGAQVGTSIDPRELVMFDDQRYAVSVEPWVSSEAISTSSVKKIAHGQISEVSIVTTSTGTYSSEGLTSPHVLYPGIQVKRMPDPNAAPKVSYLLDNAGWVTVPLDGGNSFVTAFNTPTGTMVLSGDCLISARVAMC